MEEDGHALAQWRSAGSDYSTKEFLSEFPFDNIDAELKELSARTGMPISQEHGQRFYGPPRGHIGDPPPKGCEIFIKIPRDAFEPELIPLLELIGEIYQMRLMMNFSGSNRGFAFVKFYTPEDADKAVALLNNYELRKDERLGVCKSTDNCRLYYGGIPKEKTREEILDAVSRITDNVVGVIMFHNSVNRHLNRGYAYIEYASHKAAALARRKMLMGKIQLWGNSVIVDWATNKLAEYSTPFSMAKALAAAEFVPGQKYGGHGQGMGNFGLISAAAEPQLEYKKQSQFQPLSIEVEQFEGAAAAVAEAGPISQQVNWNEFQPQPIIAEPVPVIAHPPLPPGVVVPQKILDLGMPLIVVPVPIYCPCGANKPQPGLGPELNPLVFNNGEFQQAEFGVLQPQENGFQYEQYSLGEFNLGQNQPYYLNMKSEP